MTDQGKESNSEPKTNQLTNKKIKIKKKRKKTKHQDK